MLADALLNAISIQLIPFSVCLSSLFKWGRTHFALTGCVCWSNAQRLEENGRFGSSVQRAAVIRLHSTPDSRTSYNETQHAEFAFLIFRII